MHRPLILDFLAVNNKTFTDNGMLALTIVLYNHYLKGICHLFENQEEVTVYYVKNYRIYDRIRTFDDLENTLIPFLFELKQKTTILKEQLDQNFVEPYNLKPVDLLDLKIVEAIPVFKDDEMVGNIFFYSKNNEINLNFSNQKWLSLIDKLANDKNETYQNNINELIQKEEPVSIIVKNKEKNLYYADEKIIQNGGLTKAYFDQKDQNYRKIKDFLLQMKKIETDKLLIYYQKDNENTKPSKRLELYTHHSINSHGFKKNYALIFSSDLENRLDPYELGCSLTKIIRLVLQNEVYKVYQIDKKAIAILVNRKISKKEITEMHFHLKKLYFLIINIPDDLSEKSNLYDLTTYLSENLPSSFDKKAFLEAELAKDEQQFICDNPDAVNNKILINLKTLETTGEFVNMIIPNYHNLSNYKILENAIVNILEKALKTSYDKPIFCLLTSFLTRRKIYELLKKIIVKYPNCQLLFHCPEIIFQVPADVFNNLNKIRQLGYTIYVDSSIFMSLPFSVCTKLAEGVLIRKNEILESLTEGNFFNKMVFKTLNENGYKLIFEDVPKEEDGDLIDEKSYLIINKD